jgi:hypothetical protein
MKPYVEVDLWLGSYSSYLTPGVKPSLLTAPLADRSKSWTGHNGEGTFPTCARNQTLVYQPFSRHYSTWSMLDLRLSATKISEPCTKQVFLPQSLWGCCVGINDSTKFLPTKKELLVYKFLLYLRCFASLCVGSQITWYNHLTQL